MPQQPDHISATLKKLSIENSLRSLREANAGVDLVSNDYLGLAQNKVELYGRGGATGSRLLNGNTHAHESVELISSSLFRTEAALFFSSGYMANLGLLSAAPSRHAVIHYDESVHASIKDGMRLSLTKKVAFRHNDLGHLEENLRKGPAEQYIVTESLFSMDGDSPDLVKLNELSDRYGAHLILDEAHTTGIMGPEGAGSWVGEHGDSNIFARIHTFGKAAGAIGAVVVGSRLLIDFLINRSRQFIYTTAMPPIYMAFLETRLKELAKSDILRKELWERCDLFQKEIRASAPGLVPDGVAGPVFPIRIGSVRLVKYIAESLQDAGFDVRPILSPTVQKGKEMIRVVVHAYNTPDELSSFASVLKKVMREEA